MGPLHSFLGIGQALVTAFNFFFFFLIQFCFLPPPPMKFSPCKQDGVWSEVAHSVHLRLLEKVQLVVRFKGRVCLFPSAPEGQNSPTSYQLQMKGRLQVLSSETGWFVWLPSWDGAKCSFNLMRSRRVLKTDSSSTPNRYACCNSARVNL